MPSSQFGQALQGHGFKLTRARRAVLQVLGATAQHLKIAEVHQRARQIDPRVSLASVYRTMDLLARLHLVQDVHMEHRHRHYARLSDDHGHHLICSRCGLVVEFSDCQAEVLARLLARRTHFRIDGHHLEFFGRCPRCRRETQTGRLDVRP